MVLPADPNTPDTPEQRVVKRVLEVAFVIGCFAVVVLFIVSVLSA